MPVILESKNHPPSSKNQSSAEHQKSAGECIRIGLVNNMPDGALLATERQFRTLLSSAADDKVVRLTLYALPDLPRAEPGKQHIEHFYASTEELFERQLDGLIVTGAEPRAANLTGEPYWGSLTKVLDWASVSTYSTVWSCLAAHAALLHYDGIGRSKCSRKHFGVFECERVSNHWLTTGLPTHFSQPHSRWNDISEAELKVRGYTVLSRTFDAGVDMFVKRDKSLFVFFQGHPEYDPDSLLLEYRREIGRYLRGEANEYPSIPRGISTIQPSGL